MDVYSRDRIPLAALLFTWVTAAAGVDGATMQTSTEHEFRVEPGERQLFLDDHGIAGIRNLERAMHQPVKKGAVIRPDPGVGVACVQVRTSPVWDPRQNVFRFWDCAAGPRELYDKGVHVTGYYESRDGLNWARPSLGLVEFRGSKQNNYTFLRAHGRYHRIDYVVYDPTDPDPGRRYKMAMPPVGFGASPDGIRWSAIEVAGVPGGDEANFSFDEKAHLFILTVKRGGPHGRSVYLATSTDFQTWTDHGLIFHADDTDQERGVEAIRARFADPMLQCPVVNDPAHYNVDVYNMGIFRYEGLYIGMPAMYHAVGPSASGDNTDGFHHVQLVCSRDLKTWKRLGDRRPFIGPSPRGGGAYDLTQILPPSSAVPRGDELWFYYTGIKYRRPPPDAEPDTGAICLAVLRRDGFISLDAGQEEGELLTRPFAVKGDRIFVNLTTRPDGELRVQVVDTDGAGVANSEAIEGDRVRGEVEWQQGNLAGREGQMIRLRFMLRNAGLYSYWIE